MDIGARIKELRVAKEYTQEELGAKIGVKKAAIQKYENGTVENLKRSTIMRLADILEVSPMYLMGWEEKLPLRHPHIGGMDENGNFIEEFSEEETVEIIRDLAKLPEEAIGDLKLMFAVLNHKYNKN